MDAIEIASPVGGYLVGLGVALLLGRRERSTSAEKARRYAVLPWRYRLACPLVVVPLFTALPLVLLVDGFPALAAITGLVLAPASLLLLEMAAIRWYRRAGLL